MNKEELFPNDSFPPDKLMGNRTQVLGANMSQGCISGEDFGATLMECTFKCLKVFVIDLGRYCRQFFLVFFGYSPKKCIKLSSSINLVKAHK